MNHWYFVIAAYAVTLSGTFIVTLWSYRTMRRSEARADALRKDQ